MIRHTGRGGECLARKYIGAITISDPHFLIDATFLFTARQYVV